MPSAPTGLGKQTTAEQALRGISLRGRRAIVTGAASGLGKETARALALAGAEVILAVRSPEAGARAAQELRASLPPEAGPLLPSPLDLADFGSVRAFAARVLAEAKPVHLLINNAGVMATPRGVTKQGFEQQMGVNHLGHFLLTQLLMERLAQSGPARIVTVSSRAHYRATGDGVLATLERDPRYEARRYLAFRAYAESKLANVLFARGLAKRLPPHALSFSLHPGVIATNLMRHLGAVESALFKLGARLSKTVEEGAATTVFAATAPELEGQSGLFLADCAERRPSRAALDDALVERVWAASERLTGA